MKQVYLQYTSEYMKGPMYWHPDKMQGFAPDYPGRPIVKNGKYTSNVIGNLKAFSSNELAFLSMLFFGVGLYGNLQFNYYDPQWAKVDAGGYFNASYHRGVLAASYLLLHAHCLLHPEAEREVSRQRHPAALHRCSFRKWARYQLAGSSVQDTRCGPSGSPNSLTFSFDFTPITPIFTTCFTISGFGPLGR